MPRRSRLVLPGIPVHLIQRENNRAACFYADADYRLYLEWLEAWRRRVIAQYVNRTCGRSGTLWEGRFRSCLARDRRYVPSCYRYIELNPVRACMVNHLAEYRWSIFRANGQGEHAPLSTPHADYEALGEGTQARQDAYREFLR